MITYKAIIQYFDSIAEQHQQIQSFTYGELNFFDKDKFTKYPALHLTPTGTSIDDQVVVYGFDVVIFDRYNVESNKMRNEATCLSDSLLILQDLCKEVTDGKYFINQDTLISMELPVTAQPFIDTEPDNCSGWATSFNVITPNEASACLIPYFNPEIWNNKNVTLPPGTPSQYAWFSMMDLSKNLEQTITSVKDLKPFIDTYSNSDVLTKFGEPIIYDFNKHAFHIKSEDKDLDVYLTQSSIPLSGSKFTFFIKIKDFPALAGSGGGTNRIFKLQNTAGTSNIEIYTTSTGGLTFSSPVTSRESIFPIAPPSSTNLKRKEPLVIALQFNAADTYMKCWIDDDNPIELLTSGIDLDGFSFIIGKNVPNSNCDFYLQEFLYSTSGMSESDISSTREWLKYR